MGTGTIKWTAKDHIFPNSISRLAWWVGLLRSRSPASGLNIKIVVRPKALYSLLSNDVGKKAGRPPVFGAMSLLVRIKQRHRKSLADVTIWLVEDKSYAIRSDNLTSNMEQGSEGLSCPLFSTDKDGAIERQRSCKP